MSVHRYPATFGTTPRRRCFIHDVVCFEVTAEPTHVFLGARPTMRARRSPTIVRSHGTWRDPVLSGSAFARLALEQHMKRGRNTASRGSLRSTVVPLKSRNARAIYRSKGHTPGDG